MEDIRLGVCPLCKHNKVIRSWPQDQLDALTHQPMAVAREAKLFFGATNHGVLYLYTCQRCGFSQWFAFEPEKIPIDEKSGTSLVTGPEQAGPYR
jgi:hypothetical protein